MSNTARDMSYEQLSNLQELTNATFAFLQELTHEASEYFHFDPDRDMNETLREIGDIHDDIKNIRDRVLGKGAWKDNGTNKKASKYPRLITL